ncbi:MAG: ABC transporter substrate-binding protein [Ectothiorhodospiraceae bacterium]|nr:ABC transporter substrate-binding protein [Ectothiorhodospiraceae bacterium]
MKKLILLMLATALLAVAYLFVSDPVDRRPAGMPDAVPVDPADLAARRGALVDQIVFTQESDPGKVTGMIETGTHHVFGQGVTSVTVFNRIRDSQQAAYDMSYGFSVELTLNPAGPELADGSLNPFHVPAIREAMNWLLDRRHVAEELYGGLAVPRYLPLNTAFPDYARLADVARALELRYQYDPARAERIITREMEKLGAERRGGQWLYQGQPVRLIVLIRTEDVRQRVGDYVANRLEDLGFRVERRYRAAAEASRLWLAGDPAGGQWHLYTGGWIATTINRDQVDQFSFYYTPRGRPEPLWQAYDPAPEFDEISERLQRRDYSTWEERQQLMARALELAMEDSARIWLVDQLSVSPRSREVELAADMAGGVSGSWLWPYTIRFRDRVGGTVVFALPGLLTEPWNPVAGSNWVFDSLIMRSLNDLPLLPDPFTGLYWPQRIESALVTVQEDVPVTRTHDWLALETAPEIRVPEDAWIAWDVEKQRFLTAGEAHPQGLTARTRTRVHYEEDYLQRRWHDGSQVSLADLVLPWILSFERASEDSPLYDPSHAPSFQVFQRHFRGWRIVSRDPLIIEIYSDQVFPDAETIVAQRTPSVQPWHVLALGVRAERTGELAFSSHQADRQRVDWLSLVAGPSLRVLDRQLEQAGGQRWLPWEGTLGGLVREGEVLARYQALATWRERRGHFWVGDGPFYLHDVYPVERTVVLRRNEHFPDPSDKWLRFTRPEIPELDLDGPLVVDAGGEAEFRLEITFQGERYPPEDIDLVQYLLFDSRGNLARRGEAEPDEAGTWVVRLSGSETAALGAGANSLEVAVTTGRVALPAFASHGFATVPERRAANGGGAD